MAANENLPRLDSYFWAGALILAGFVFGAVQFGVLPQIGNATPWSWVFLGAGLLGLGLSYYALVSAKYAKPTWFDWVFGALLLAFGIGNFLGVDIALPILLSVAGLAGVVNLLISRN